MGKRTPVYANRKSKSGSGARYITGHFEEIKFNEKDEEILTKICAHPEFINGIKQIKSNYEASLMLYHQLTSDADNIATMNDLGITVKELKDKLANMPSRVEAHLYKFSDQMSGLESSLLSLWSLIERAKLTMPMPKTKPKDPATGAKTDAARGLRNHFKKFGLPFTRKQINNKENFCPADVCLKIIIGDFNTDDHLRNAKK